MTCGVGSNGCSGERPRGNVTVASGHGARHAARRTTPSSDRLVGFFMMVGRNYTTQE